MKYFTYDRWMGDDDSWETSLEDYWTYFKSVRTKLPKPLVELEEVYTLHDARVQSVVQNETSRTLIMVLDGWEKSLSNALRFTLIFSDVTNFTQNLDHPEQKLSELDDLGYTEIELFGSGIEMRMLFASSAEFSVTFSGFHFDVMGR